MSIQLRGKDGNTLAAGSRINVKLDDGTRRSVEVASGGGYLSQSSSLVNVGVPSGVKVVNIDVRWPDGTAKESSAVDISKTGKTGKTVEIQQ